MKKGIFIFILLFAGLFWATEESFPVYKYDGISRDVQTNWNADSAGYLFYAPAGDSLISRAWSPTSHDPRKLIGSDNWNGLVSISFTVDTVKTSTKVDTLRFVLQKQVANDQWVTVEDSIAWSLASNPDSTIKLITGAHEGVQLYYQTDPTSNNTTHELERHPSSIHRLIAIAAGSDSCKIYLNHVWDAY